MAHSETPRGEPPVPTKSKRRRSPLPPETEALIRGVSDAALASTTTGSYTSPSRAVLDAIGAPPAIQRVAAAVSRTPPAASTGEVAPSSFQQIMSVADIGSRIKIARAEMGMTQQRFADLAGVGRRFLIELEHGKPGLEIGKVLEVCRTAGIRIGFLP
jgi:y4mF family transcriptional regulator